MPATKHTAELNTFNYAVSYYPARLSDDDLHALKVWAGVCRNGDVASPLLSAYLYALHSFEIERRAAIDEGYEILEVEMPGLPAAHWSNTELTRALGKLTSIAFSTDGEVCVLMKKLCNVVVAEIQYRFSN